MLHGVIPAVRSVVDLFSHRYYKEYVYICISMIQVLRVCIMIHELWMSVNLGLLATFLWPTVSLLGGWLSG